jgi:hypothetical protein
MASPHEQTAASPGATLPVPEEDSRPEDGEGPRPGPPPLASRPTRTGQPRADPPVPAIGAGELSRQFEVIRKVLERRRATEGEAGPGSPTAPEPTAAKQIAPMPAGPRPVEPKPVEPRPVEPQPAAVGSDLVVRRNPASVPAPRTAPEQTAARPVASAIPRAVAAPRPAAVAGSEPVWQRDQDSFVSHRAGTAATGMTTKDETTRLVPGPGDSAVRSRAASNHRSRASRNSRDRDKDKHRSRGVRRAGRGQIAALVVVLIAVFSCAVAAGFAATHHPTVVTTVNQAPTVGAPTAAETTAATWIVAAVGPSKVVACDVSVCALLQERGFPSSSLVTVRLGLSDIEQADAVVLTPVLRAQLGSSVNAIISTEPLAVFGTGADRVEVAAVALAGPSTYAQNLTADRASRRSAGAALLGNTRLTVTGPARAMLADGLVDARICALLALLAGSHSIVVAGFTPIPPGAGPDVPSAGVLIESVDGQSTAGPSGAANRQLLLTLIAAQEDPYLPLSAAPGALNGTSGLAIVYAQPGPLGLLTGSTS